MDRWIWSAQVDAILLVYSVTGDFQCKFSLSLIFLGNFVQSFNYAYIKLVYVTFFLLLLCQYI